MYRHGPGQDASDLQLSPTLASLRTTGLALVAGQVLPAALPLQPAQCAIWHSVISVSILLWASDTMVNTWVRLGSETSGYTPTQWGSAVSHEARGKASILSPGPRGLLFMAV